MGPCADTQGSSPRAPPHATKQALPSTLGLVIIYFIRLRRISTVPQIKKKSTKLHTKHEIRRLNFPDSGPSSAKEKKKRV